MGGAAVVPDASLGDVLEGGGQAFLQGVIKTRAVHYMTEFMHQDALQPHAALVFHHVFLGEHHGRTRADAREKTAPAPVVEVQFLADFVRGKLRQLGGQFVVADQETEHAFLANALGDLRLQAAHQHVELIGRLVMRHIGHEPGGNDQDALNLRRLFVKSGVQLVLARLRLGQGFHGKLRRRHQRQREQGCD